MATIFKTADGAKPAPSTSRMAFENGKISTAQAMPPKEEKKKIQDAEEITDRLLNNLWSTYEIAREKRKYPNGIAGKAQQKANNAFRTFFTRKGSLRRKQPANSINKIKAFLKAVQKTTPDSLERHTRERIAIWKGILAGCMSRRSDNELDHAVRMADDRATLDLLLSQSKGIKPVDLRAVLAAIREAAAQEKISRFVVEPINILLECGRSDLNTTESYRPELCAAMTENTARIRDAMSRLHYGLETMRLPNQTRREYLAQLLAWLVREKDRHLLSTAIAAEDDGKAKVLLEGIRANGTSELLTAYHQRVFNELRAMVRANGMPFDIDPSSDWPNKAVGAARPHHEAGWIRRVGSFLYSSARYFIGSADYRAKARLRYQQENIDREVDALLRTLALSQNYKQAKTAIDRRLDRLCVAVQGLHVELYKQDMLFRVDSDDCQTDVYLNDALERRFCGLSGKSMKRMWEQMNTIRQEPSARAQPNLFRKFLYGIELRWHNRFHDPAIARMLKEQKEWTPRGVRVDRIWEEIKHLLPLEASARGFETTLTSMSRLLNTRGTKDYQAIGQHLLKLGKLDAQENDGVQEIRHHAFKIALKRLKPADFDALMRRLDKYSITSGKNMSKFFKPQEQGNKPIKEETWMYNALLEKLYAAGLTLDWTPPVGKERDPETDESGNSTPKPSSGGETPPIQAAKRLALCTAATTMPVFNPGNFSIRSV